MLNDPYVLALKALCEANDGYRSVAAAIHANPQSIWQIISGTKLPSGNPKSVGPQLRRKLDSVFPNWQNLSKSVKYTLDSTSTPPTAQEPGADYDNTESITIEQTLSRLGEFLADLEPEKHEGFIAILKLMMANPKNELYPIMLAQLFPQSKSAFVSKRITPEQQQEIGNVEKPPFVK